MANDKRADQKKNRQIQRKLERQSVVSGYKLGKDGQTEMIKKTAGKFAEIKVGNVAPNKRKNATPGPEKGKDDFTRLMKQEFDLEAKSGTECKEEAGPPPPGHDDGKPLEPGALRGIILWEGEGPLPPGPKYEPSTPKTVQTTPQGQQLPPPPPAPGENQTVLILPELPKDVKEKFETRMQEKRKAHEVRIHEARAHGHRPEGRKMEQKTPDFRQDKNLLDAMQQEIDPQHTQEKVDKFVPEMTPKIAVEITIPEKYQGEKEKENAIQEMRTPEAKPEMRTPENRRQENPRGEFTPQEILDEESLVESQYRFMISLIESWEKQGEGNLDNFITSPVSLHTVLTMLMLGCKSNTYEQVKTSLGFEQLVKEKILKSYQKLLIELHNTAWSKECFVGNALIANNTAKIEPQFNDILQMFFKNHVIQEDFSDQNLANKVNFWTKKNTNKRIDDVVKVIDKDYKLIALSAVYLEAVWSTGYDKKETKAMAFNNYDQTPGQVKAMCAKRRYKSNETKYGIVIFLPYKKKTLQFTIFLPNEELFSEAGSFSKFIRIIGPKVFQSLFTVTNRIEVDIAIPKFILESKHQNWKAILTTAGFGELFESPDMSAMFTPENEGVKLNDFMHTAVIKIDETGVHPPEKSFSPRNKTPTPIKFDRPFFCMLSHRQTKAPVFIGLIQKF